LSNWATLSTISGFTSQDISTNNSTSATNLPKYFKNL